MSVYVVRAFIKQREILLAQADVLAKWREGDSLDEVVLVLYDLGQDAHTAVPDLVSLLKRPERANPYYVISALRTAGDSSNIDDIKRFLKHSNEHVRREATDAINALTKKEG
jgi:hypothetical protein